MRALLLTLLAACTLPATETQAMEPPAAKESPMECTVRVSPGEPIAPHLAPGAVICLAEGVHEGGLVLTHSVTLKGEKGAVLDGKNKGPVVLVGTHQLEVRLEGLTLTGGAHELGSGVLVEGYSTVELVGCTVKGNAHGDAGGAGLAVRSGWVTVTDCTFDPKDDLVFTTKAEVTLVNTDIGGDVLISDGAKVEATGGRIGGTVTMRGTTTRAPEVTLTGVDAQNLANDPNLPAALTVR